ncbi:putative beta-lactamase domain-containing protein 2 [Apostichopus japonicus]|uniref:Putative beta-lactamase domain-containing protein 2 n=1 Tax=Stichopus japonicus TaxID=307972 RepID=A0A2G8JUV1_STIJA|nr:putative beta-lactamase domain-containing protein 2 [Apostichopus japonicus]
MSFLRASIVCVTAVIVGLIIPTYLKPSYPVPEIFGTVAPGFEEVRDVFRQNYEEGWDKRDAGSAFSVYKDGEKVVDLWAGYADAEAKRLWREDTMTEIFSTTKGLTAVCLAMLSDRGLLDFKKTVAHYWPEFAQNGKERITVEQLLEHEAGLLATDEPLSYDILKNRTELDRILAATKPIWEPGTKHGYHGITFGLYSDALVRRVDIKKRTVGQFFDEEVRKPFDIDLYIGTPLELFHRLGRLTNVQAGFGDVIYAIKNSVLIQNAVLSTLLGGENADVNKRMLESCGNVCEFERFADPYVMNVEFASGNGVGTARAIAKLFGILANGGKYRNTTLLSKKIIDEYVNDKRPLTPDLLMFDHPMRWKYAMDVIPQGDNMGNLFGAPGAGGQIGYADPNNKIGYGFVSRYMSTLGIQLLDPRIQRLIDSVKRSI